MAELARAHAQTRAFPASGDLAPIDLDGLALQACDDAGNLNDVMRAYAALEKLIDTSTPNECELLPPSRTELSALLRLLNDALLARIDNVSGATGAVREALGQTTHGNGSTDHTRR
jgi:hypothetical protein